MKSWQGENDFSLFKSSMPVSSQQIATLFYQFHKNKIGVKKEKIAIDKLKTIIKATFKLSNQKGFASMSLRDLNYQTKISMGSLYAYIGSKRQLAEMIHQFLPHIFNLCIGQQIIASEKAKSQLKKLLRGHLFLTECLQDWFFFAFIETKHLSHSVKKLAKENQQNSENTIKKILQKGEKEGTFSSCDQFLSAMMIKNLLQNWYVKRPRYQQQQVDCESYIQFIEQVIGNHLLVSSEKKQVKRR